MSSPSSSLLMATTGTFQHQTFHTWINPPKVVKLTPTHSSGAAISACGARGTATNSEPSHRALWNLWHKAHRDILKVRLKCILWAINCQHGLKCEPVFSIKLPCSLLNGDKLGFYCVWGCWLFPHTRASEHNKWKSDIIIIKIENRDTLVVESGKWVPGSKLEWDGRESRGKVFFN